MVKAKKNAKKQYHARRQGARVQLDRVVYLHGCLKDFRSIHFFQKPLPVDIKVGLEGFGLEGFGLEGLGLEGLVMPDVDGLTSDEESGRREGRCNGGGGNGGGYTFAYSSAIMR